MPKLFGQRGSVFTATRAPSAMGSLVSDDDRSQPQAVDRQSEAI
jgi:hypothetical protein